MVNVKSRKKCIAHPQKPTLYRPTPYLDIHHVCLCQPEHTQRSFVDKVADGAELAHVDLPGIIRHADLQFSAADCTTHADDVISIGISKLVGEIKGYGNDQYV